MRPSFQGFGLDLVALLVALSALAPSMPAQSGQSCRVSAESPRRLELPDGQVVSVDVRSIAASGGSVMAVGRYAYVFPRPSSPRLSPVRRDFLGVIIDSALQTRIVPSPLPGRPVDFARVASGPGGSFHALFVTGDDSISSALSPLDSGSLWYARYVNGAWLPAEHVSEVREAAIHTEFTSALLERDGSLAFLYPFMDDAIGPSGGIVLLRRRNGHWASDTLRVSGATFVRATHAARGEGLVVLVARNGTGTSAVGGEVLLFQFDSSFTDPRPIGGNSELIVSDLALARVGEGFAASWGFWKWMQDVTNVVEWRRIGQDSLLSSVQVIDSGGSTHGFEMTALGDRDALWLYRGEPYGTTARLALGRDSTAIPLGQVTIPLENPTPRTLALSDTRVLVFTIKQGRRDDEPMAASYSIALDIRCPSPERR